MSVTNILESLGREPAEREAWHRTALDVGAVLRSLSDQQVGDLADGLSRLARRAEDPVLEGMKKCLLALLSGWLQASTGEDEQALLESDVERLTSRTLWVSIVAAMVALGGHARHGKLRQAVSKSRGRELDGGQLSNTLNEMAAAGLIEDVAVPEGKDQRARLCRLTRQGRLLANALSSNAVDPPAELHLRTKSRPKDVGRGSGSLQPARDGRGRRKKIQVLATAKEV